MTDAIVSLEERRKQRELDNRPHIAGEAICVGCRYTWMAVAPKHEPGTKHHDDLECPQCHAMRGVWLRNFGVNVGENFFVCPCESVYFSVLTTGVMCIACGHRVSFARLAELA